MIPVLGFAMLYSAAAASFGSAALGVTLGASAGVALATALQKLR
jgi:hypothetical protein